MEPPRWNFLKKPDIPEENENDHGDVNREVIVTGGSTEVVVALIVCNVNMKAEEIIAR